MSSDDDVRELAEEVRRRLAAGTSLHDVARWLYSDPAAGRPISAIKALRLGSGFELARCKEIVDDVIVELDPEYFDRGVLEMRRAFVEAMGLPEDEDPGAAITH